MRFNSIADESDLERDIISLRNRTRQSHDFEPLPGQDFFAFINDTAVLGADVAFYLETLYSGRSLVSILVRL
jgi:hypothetical protein